MTNINYLRDKILDHGYTAEVYETNAGQLILHVTASDGHRWTLAGMEMQTGSLRDALNALAQGASPDAWDGYDHLDDDAWDTLDGGEVVLSTYDGVAASPTKWGVAAHRELDPYIVDGSPTPYAVGQDLARSTIDAARGTWLSDMGSGPYWTMSKHICLSDADYAAASDMLRRALTDDDIREIHSGARDIFVNSAAEWCCWLDDDPDGGDGWVVTYDPTDADV